MPIFSKALGSILVASVFMSVPSVSSAEEILPAPVQPQPVSNDVSVSAVPAAPTNFRIARTYGTSVEMYWTPPAETLLKYTFSFSKDNINWTTLDLSHDCSGQLIGGMNEQTTYYYKFSAVTAGGSSTPITGTYTTVTNISLPAAPTLLTVSSVALDNNRLNVSWKAPTSSGTNLTDYKVQYSKDNVNWYTYPDTVNINASLIMYGLNSGTKYYVRVAAVNSIGQGAWSTVTSATTTGTPATVVSAPTEFTVVNTTATTASLKWVHNNDSGIKDYKIEYKLSSEGTWSSFADGISTNKTAIVTGLKYGSKYMFRVSAQNVAGYSTPSTVKYADTKTQQAPGVPETVTVKTGTSTSLKIGWKKPLNDGGMPITDYVVMYKEATSATWLTFNDGVSTNLETTITGLTKGKTYNYKVAAKNALGQSAFTSLGTVLLSPPNAPQTLGGVAVQSAIWLFWGAPVANRSIAIHDYTIQYREKGSATWLTYNDGVSAINEGAVTDLVTGKTYEVRVAAKNGVGQSAWSNIFTATTAL